MRGNKWAGRAPLSLSLEEDVSQAGALGTSQPSQAQWLAEAKRNREATWPGLLPTPPRTLGALPPWKKEAHPGTVSEPLRIHPTILPTELFPSSFPPADVPSRSGSSHNLAKAAADSEQQAGTDICHHGREAWTMC